jgi:4,5-DOPA dioxygenase extradiol
MASLPSLFISHGSPMTVLSDTPARRFLDGLAGQVPAPQAILCVSAHWETARPAVSTAAQPETIHDFGGFPDALFQIVYPAPGAPELAGRVRALLDEAGLVCDLDPARGLDHGAWTPLLLAWPEADVPVTQLSIQHHLGPAHHLKLGAALAPLRAERVLILGSGAATHNLRAVAAARAAGGVPQTPGWAQQFDDWLAERVEAGAHEDLVDYRNRAPGAEMSHPRDEHYLPLLVAAGAAPGPGRVLHRSFDIGSLSMAAYAFGAG